MPAVAELLGVSVSGPLPLMSAVRDGLPLAALERLVQAVAPADGAFAYRIVPRATLTRRRASRSTGRLSPNEGAQVARLAAVWAMALDVWRDDAAARRFMFEAHPLLEGRPPIDVVLESELGRPIVEGILGRLRYGSAV